MKLPFSFTKSKKQARVFYLALILTSEKATAIILEQIGDKLKIIKSKNQYFEDSIEVLPIEDLISAVDKALSRAVEEMPADLEISKTVFGVKEKWVEKESKKIKKDYLHKLKKVCDALELTPIGFMVVSEAIANLIQKEEGAPVSAILAEHGHKTIALTLIRGGRNIQTIEGALLVSAVQTVDNLLKHFATDVLPARVILYDDETAGELAQQFIGHTWSKSLPFLHMPQISVLPNGFSGQAVAYGAATQMGFEVLKSDGMEIRTYKQGGGVPEVKKTVEVEEEIDKEEDLSGEENFGFVTGKDISEIEVRKVAKLSDNISDITPVQNDEEAVDKNLQDVIVEEEDNSSEPGKKEAIFDKIKLPKMRMPNFAFNGIFLFFIIAVILIGAAAGGGYYFYATHVKASVVVNLSAKKIVESRDVVFTSASSSDFSNNILAADEVKDSLGGDMTIGATGKKDIGDKAKGSVTIYNNSTDSDAKLTSGTAIKSDNGLSFVLDKDVSVASASGDVFSGTKPGTANVDVTAGDIGTNYNLPSGTKFSVAGNSSLAGKNDDAFSGGSKSAVKVVSNDDLVQLKTDLVKNLEDKALGQLTKKTDAESTILPVILATSVDQSKYDKKAGDESKTVKLTATINFMGLAYKNEEAKKFAQKIIEEKYGGEMTFNAGNTEIKVKDASKESEEEVGATLSFGTSLLPKIDTGSLAKQLSGKSKQATSNTLSHLKQVENTEITYSPKIYFLEKLFPNLPNNVTVTISSN